MHPFFFVVYLPLSLATATNFTQVFEWNELDYEWPSEKSRTQALEDGSFIQKNIDPIHIAVYETRIFLSLDKYDGIPVTLVSLPTSSASTAPPKLNAFPSWDLHEYGHCDKIESSRGLQVDTVGRLWVLDSGSKNCKAKIWTINLSNNDQTELIHRLSFVGWVHDLVLDETSDGTFAYISRWGEKHIVVFNFERNQSWIAYTQGIAVFSIALTPKDQEPRHLYLGRYPSKELYSISVAALRNGTRTAYPKLIGNWTATNSYRMLMDNHGTMYSAFWERNFIHVWNTSQPFQEQHFLEVGKPTTILPFTFALDSTGTFWLTLFNDKETKPRCSLLKAEVGAKPYSISDSPTSEVSAISSTTITPNCACEEKQTEESFNSALIGSLAFFLVLSCIITLWLTLRIRKLRNSTEQCNADAVEMEIPTLPNPVSPEMVHEEIENDLYGVVTARALPPRIHSTFCYASVVSPPISPSEQFENRRGMAPFNCYVVFLCLSVANAVNFTPVYNWQNGMDYEWPSEASRKKALKDKTFKPENIEPRFMAVYKTRIFLSLEKKGIPVSLVSLPTTSASSAPPKLTPFPSWDKYNQLGRYCTKIEAARGLEVDATGRLWVLDNGSNNCDAKLRIYNLEKNDELELEHRFSFHGSTNDLVLDQTLGGYVAYFARWNEEHIVVFNLQKNQSWFLNTKGIKWDGSIALAPKNKPRELYISKHDSTELFSISVEGLRDETHSIETKPIGRWTASPTRMLMDSNGTLYAAFWSKNYIATRKTTQIFQEKRFNTLEAGSQNNNWPFSFALDSSGTLWMTEPNERSYSLLKAAVGASSYIYDYPPTVATVATSTATPTHPTLNNGRNITGKLQTDSSTQEDFSPSATTVTPYCPSCEKELQKEGSPNSALIGSLGLFLVLSCTFNLWLTLRIRKLQNSNEQRNAGAEEMEIPTLPNPVSPEMVHEEIENDLYGVFSAPAPRPRL
ncbi:Hypothetical predicted protein [Cloeon dipterum]|uniref:Bee-milk protein n=1 Tax=Cloeon dipterum TaxID=197152 RepID=A0A8S1DNJ7_9INSE|nr:Hypothetical predicted protein [Cloeon dipterum]